MSDSRGGGGGGRGGGRGPVKIVLINTQYVEADEMSFKSVVQELTGKDSGVSTNNNNINDNILQKRKSRKGQNGGMNMKESASESFNNGDSSVLMRDHLSFKEFDRLLKEMPPVDDELYDGFWAY